MVTNQIYHGQGIQSEKMMLPEIIQQNIWYGRVK